VVSLHVRPVPVLPRSMLGGITLHPGVTLRRPVPRVPVHSGAVLSGVLLHSPVMPRLCLSWQHEGRCNPERENRR